MDEDKLVDIVTRIIMERLGGRETPTGVVTFGDVPAGILAPGVETRRGVGPADVAGSQVIVMTIDAFRAFHGGGTAGVASLSLPAAGSPSPSACCGEVDLTGKRVITEVELRGAGAVPGSRVRVCPKAIVTSLANDYAKANGISISRG